MQDKMFIAFWSAQVSVPTFGPVVCHILTLTDWVQF